MFEPPILDQLMGVGALLIGFAGAYRHIKMQEKRKEEERREEQEFASMIIQGYNHAYERGREDKWQEIRKNIRREFKGFTYDNEPPVGLRSEHLGLRQEPLALPEPKMHILKRGGQEMEELIEWLDNLTMIVKELKGRESASRHFIKIWENDYKNLLLIKEYLNDYEKLAKDYRDVALKNKLLKIEKMELEGRYIYEDMRMKYRANRRKWGARYV